MKLQLFHRLCIILAFLAGAYETRAQLADSTEKDWEVEASLLWYSVPADHFLLPMVQADKGRLHLESRYNYEDRNTVSFFAGYNFTGGKKLSYTITPMLGIAVGQLDGLAPGLEVDLSLGKFELYSEMEYLFAFEDNANSYYYNWTELNFYLKDGLWVGLTAQKTKAYQTEVEIQRGMLAGFQWKRASITGYLFNPFMAGTFGIVSMGFQIR